MNKIEPWMLKQRQSLPLEQKIRLTASRIRTWYDHWQGNIYVSFSGGKDSTVLLHLVRSMYPDIPAVFCDTGLEFPEIREFVKPVDNVTWVRPKINFRAVLDKYGYPVVSKEVSQKLHEARTTKSEKLLHKRLHGDDNKYKSGKIPNKWQYLIKAPFKISHMCCKIMKKDPAKVYQKTTGRLPLLGTMAADSHLRKQRYLRSGCNSFEGKIESAPLAFWLEEDIWNYIRAYQVPYSPIYDMGYTRTGCIFCCFGAHLECPSKFQRMELSHPKLHAYCMDKLGLQEVLDTVGVESRYRKRPVT